MIKFKYENAGLNAAISKSDVNGRVALPAIHSVKAVPRMPRIMRAQIEFRVFMNKCEEF